jgi:protoheme IX farnesyltransferase
MPESITTTTTISTGVKIRAFVELLKVRLSLLVAFSCAFGYGLATRGNMDWQVLIMLTLGGFSAIGSFG